MSFVVNEVSLYDKKFTIFGMIKPIKPIIPVNDTATAEISMDNTKNAVLHIFISTPNTYASMSPREIISSFLCKKRIVANEDSNNSAPSSKNSEVGIDTLPTRNENV